MNATHKIFLVLALGSVAYAGIGENRLLQPAPFDNDWFGKTLEVSGDQAVFGDVHDDANGEHTGAAYVYEKKGSRWALQTVVRAPDGKAGDWFGYRVAIDGETLVVGAWLDDTVAGLRSGSTYVFVRNGDEWALQAKLRPSDHEPNDRFGMAVEIEGDTLAVASGPDLTDTRRNYIFRRVGTVWTEEANIVGGGTFDVSGDRFVLGRSSTPVTVYKRTGTAWQPEVQLTPNGSIHGFGWEVAIDGALLVVTDWTDAVVVFERTGGVWSETGTIPNPLGYRTRVAEVSDGRILVSYDGFGSKPTLVYERRGSSFVETVALHPADPPHTFGRVISISGDNVVVGSRVSLAPGEVHAFTLSEQLGAWCDASDGSLASCPCANPGKGDTGCDIDQGTGGVRLDVTGLTVGPQNRATAIGTGYPPLSTPSATLMRSAILNPSGSVVFGDGVFCLANPVVRLEGAIGSDGQTRHVFGHGAMAGSGTFYYQLHYRSLPAMSCTPDAFNLSSGRAIVW
jgi:hypothetical protein